MTFTSCLKISLLLSTLGVETTAFSQDIRVDTLGSASAYDAGLLDASSGGLDAALWQGTTASMATAVIEAAPIQTRRAIIRDLVRVSLLSAGVPPQAKNGDAAGIYNQARIGAISQMGDRTATNALIQRAPNLVQDPVLKSELALLSGDTQTACSVAATISEGRATPQWARLRAYCHALADEIPAAELTTDLLAQSGYEDPTFFKLMSIILSVSKPSKATENLVYEEGLDLALAELAGIETGTGALSSRLAAKRAMDMERSADERLKALFEGSAVMSDLDIKTVLEGFTQVKTVEETPQETQGLVDGGVTDIELSDAELIETAPVEVLDIDIALKETPALGFGQLYALVSRGDTPEVRARAIVEFLKRAEKNGQFDRFSNVIASDLESIPVNIQAMIGLKTFTRLAITRNDIVSLQGLYNGVEAGIPQRGHLALIADAIGNGFFGGGLGSEIEARLTGEDKAEKSAALRESYIAVAMGAIPSAEAALIIASSGKGAGRAAKPGALLALNSAARRSARGETALRSAAILAGGQEASTKGNDPLDAASLASVIIALRTAGMDQFAGRLAAEDFLSGL